MRPKGKMVIKIERTGNRHGLTGNFTAPSGINLSHAIVTAPVSIIF